MELSRAVAALLSSPTSRMSEPCLRSASRPRGTERHCSSSRRGNAVSSFRTSSPKRFSAEERRRRDPAGVPGTGVWFTRGHLWPGRVPENAPGKNWESPFLSRSVLPRASLLGRPVQSYGNRQRELHCQLTPVGSAWI